MKRIVSLLENQFTNQESLIRSSQFWVGNQPSCSTLPHREPVLAVERLVEGGHGPPGVAEHEEPHDGDGDAREAPLLRQVHLRPTVHLAHR